jgi:hypothetical protein
MRRSLASIYAACAAMGLGIAGVPDLPAAPAVPRTVSSAMPASMATTAEASGFIQTGRYAEAERLCQTFAAAFPDAARCLRFGVTPEGRPMLALVAALGGAGAPADGAQARALGRPVFLFQAGVHAGEIDGKDAGFLVLRDLLSRRDPVLQRTTAVFVPVFNVDGHERFGPNNRPNQNGPAQMGWRTTAQNLNLNRDFMKAETPEMAAMLSLLREWDPLIYADLHVTDGADFQPDVAVMVEPILHGDPALRPAAAALRDALLRDLGARDHKPLPFYPSFEREDDPASGFSMNVPPPRFSTGYWAQHNRLAVLVETHSWKPYKDRVRATADTLRALFAALAAHGPAWLAAARAADQAALRLGGAELPLSFEHTERAERLRFPGYAYTQTPSAISGAVRIRYDRRRPQIWDVPYYPDVRPVQKTTLPRGGYLVPAAYAPLVEAKLRLHGVSSTRLQQPLRADAEVFRISEKKFREAPFESRQTVQVRGAWRRETRELPPGSLFVPVSQRAARVLAHLLEPQAPDSLLAWGFFHAALEQKEYMEPYVAEAVAEEMLARDARLRETFQRRLREDPAFARDPAARLRFFHQHHPSWDDRLDLYPIYRTDQDAAQLIRSMP